MLFSLLLISHGGRLEAEEHIYLRRMRIVLDAELTAMSSCRS